MESRANQCARSLIDGGLQPGDRVAICLENSIDAIVWLFGVLKARGVFFIVDPRAGRERLAQLFADSQATALVSRPGPIEWMERVRPAAVPPTSPQAAADTDLAALIYTSGSTGGPKGVMLTHRNLTWAATAISTYLENTADDVILSVLPLAFTYGLGQVTTAFRVGATLVLERSFAYPAAILNTMARERVTGFALVPTIATLLLQRDLRAHRLPHLRYITNAAAALSPAKIARLREAFPHAKLFSMYGLTECQRASYLPPDQIDSRPTSVGRALPGTEALVVDDRGRPAPPGVIGELVVRGPHVMQGYWNRPDPTTRVLRNGPLGARVLHTGDLFTMDREGFLYFVSRKDDIIKTRGEKVAPREIEDTIAGLPGVAEVAVYGIPDDVLGEAIAAVVTLSPGAAVTADGVRRHCLEHLEPFMVPTTVDIRDALPTTTTGKVSRRALRATAALAEGTCA
jgi:long-chain acyl-CoA synthetase